MPTSSCPSCGHRFNFGLEDFHRPLECSRCGTLFTVGGGVQDLHREPDQLIDQSAAEMDEVQPPSRRWPAGVVAAASVGAGLIVVAVGTAAVSLWGSGAAVAIRTGDGRGLSVVVPGGGSAAERPREGEAELLTRVAGHHFWRVPVSPEMIRTWVSGVCQEGGNTWVFLDDHFRSAAHRGDMASATRQTMRQSHVVFRPKGVGPRCIDLDLQGFSKRPTLEEILRRLPDKLDYADFHEPAPADQDAGRRQLESLGNQRGAQR